MIAGTRQRWLRVALIALASAALCWPAIVNGYPLLAPDVLAYLGDGGRVWKALLGHGDAWFTPGRPEAYSAVIFLVDWGRTAWSAVLLQAVLTAWILWLVVRTSGFRRAEAVYGVMMAVLCAGSSLAWTVSWPMPDVLGPLVYLSAAMLAFAADGLSRAERYGVWVVGLWGIAAHPSHLLIAGCLCGFLALLCLGRWRGVRWAGVGAVAGMILAAMVLQMAVHARILGKASLNGPRPPYLMARLIADGPARQYLKSQCAQVDWLLCKSQDKLSDDPDAFLWLPGSVWLEADWRQQAELRREEMPLVMGTLRAYPRQQAKRSLRNAWEQLLAYRIDVFPGQPWIAQHIAAVIPNGSAVYARTLQARDAVRMRRADAVAYALVPVSLAMMLLLVWFVRRDRWMMGLIGVIAVSVLVNALVTGVLSEVSARYQSRVVWMMPMLALLMGARVWEARRVRRAT